MIHPAADACSPWRRVARGAAAALALLFTGACGPGVGGSGTGLDPGPGGAVATAPPSIASYADRVDGTRVQVRVSGSALQLDVACPRLAFAGVRDAAMPQLFVGTVAADPPLPATVEVSGPAATDLSLTLRNSAGTVLFGPVPLRETAPLAALAGCT